LAHFAVILRREEQNARVASSATQLEPLLRDCARHFAALRRGLKGIAEPKARLITASKALEQLRQEVAAVAEVRDQCIADLAASGCSYQDIADAGRVTKGRVAHIVADRRA
jgi:hypothetical protein